MLLGGLSLWTWLRLYPMNLICIIIAQGNGMVFIVVGFIVQGRILWIV